MSGPFGTGGYGTSPFGGSPSGVSLDYAWATATRSVKVQATGPLRAADAFDVGDALNPATWSVTRVSDGAPFTVLAAEADAGGDAVTLSLLEQLGSSLVAHRVSAPTLLSAGGSLIVAPRSVDFVGLTDVQPTTPMRVRRARWRDLANPVRVDDRYARFVGTILVTKGGDYATEEDVDVVRKGVLRRLFTPRGGHRHLPNYGLGLAVKQPVPQGGDKIALEAEAERQVMQEQDVVEATARYDVIARGVVLLTVRAQTSSGLRFQVGLKRDVDGRFVEV